MRVGENETISKQDVRAEDNDSNRVNELAVYRDEDGKIVTFAS